MSSYLKWGILGAGGIAKAFAVALPKSRTGRLAAVGSRDGEKAARFAAEYGVGARVARAHGSYEALLADPEVEAVYIATPHPSHAEWAIRAARAGKHILCEKPLALNHAEAMRVAEAAQRHGVFLMEAFMYRCHPLTAKLVELVRAGTLGEVGVIQATFSFQAKFDPNGRLFSNELGGGGILDVGCYTTSISRLVAGAALGRPFADPERITGCARLHPETGVDCHAVAALQFPGGIVGQLAAGIDLNQENGLRVFGSQGSLHIASPYVIARDGGEASLVVKLNGKAEETVTVRTDLPLYALEADAVGDAVARGELESPCVPVDDTLGNMAVLDAWRASVGLTYRSEAFDGPVFTVDRAPLRKQPDAPMRYAAIDGVAIRVSRLIIGCDNQTTISHMAAILDDFFERGGNAFDTAHLYGGGLQERLLGRWIERRGIRAETVVIAKGAHTPFCTPEWLVKQLSESLDRLATDYADMYLMHRDNPAVPVGEFVEVLNEQHRAGRIRAFGGSNWSLARLREANRYAEQKGLRKFTLVSNNFSLARMVSPVWDGCIAASEPEFKKWLTESNGGVSLLPWSSQARGFFTERAGRDKRGDAELVRCWYSDDNFERRERAVALARRKGVEPINIALAYVLCQPFSSFALVGPRSSAEIASTFAGLFSISLTPEELAWLNLERESP